MSYTTYSIIVFEIGNLKSIPMPIAMADPDPNGAKLKISKKVTWVYLTPIVAGQIDPRYLEMRIILTPFDPEKSGSFKGEGVTYNDRKKSFS
jgi:hypothetical protein